MVARCFTFSDPVAWAGITQCVDMLDAIKERLAPHLLSLSNST